MFLTFFTFILCNFLVQTLQYFLKNSKLIFCPWKHKKRASKVAHNRPQTFFSQYCPAAETSQELISNIMNMSQDSSVSLSVIVPQQAAHLMTKTEDVHAPKKSFFCFLFAITPTNYSFANSSFRTSARHPIFERKKNYEFKGHTYFWVHTYITKHALLHGIYHY